jgi:hypothetical protein
MRILQTALAIALLSTPSAIAGDKTLMHCFAWTEKTEATPADWEAFSKASDDLPKRIKGVIRVWYGSLVSPLQQLGFEKIDQESFAKLNAGTPVTAEVRRIRRQFGMCMEMSGTGALKAYDADPYHKVWNDAYERVRVEGTTTFDIVGR